MEGSSTGACSTEDLRAVASETVSDAGSGLRKFEVADARLSRAFMRSIWLAPEPACSRAGRRRRASAMPVIVAAHGRGSSTCDRRGDRAVSQECKSQWETSGGGGSSWKGSPDCRWRRARSGRASILMGCGPSPPRRSPADVTTSPASKSTSSSPGERVWQNFLDSEKEMELALASMHGDH